MMKQQKPVIDCSEKRNIRIRRAEQLISTIATFVLWIVAFYAIRHILVLGNYPQDSMMKVFAILLLATLLLLFTSAFWQVYNICLFRGRDRRKAVPMPSEEQLAATFSMTLQTYEAVQHSAYVEVSSLDGRGYCVMK